MLFKKNIKKSISEEMLSKIIDLLPEVLPYGGKKVPFYKQPLAL
jgi:hypothetical protein